MQIALAILRESREWWVKCMIVFMEEISSRTMCLFLSSHISQVIMIMRDLAPLALSAVVELEIASQNPSELLTSGHAWGFSAQHPSQSEARLENLLCPRALPESVHGGLKIPGPERAEVFIRPATT